jgi:hypothetical protein
MVVRPMVYTSELFKLKVVYNDHALEFIECPRPWWRRLIWKPWVKTELRPGFIQVGDTIVLNPAWRQVVTGGLE